MHMLGKPQFVKKTGKPYIVKPLLITLTPSGPSPRRIAVLSSFPPPQSVKGLRSFIGVYKVLGRVLPNCSDVVDPP